MELSSVILGALMTEKSERLKGQRVYTLRVHSHATKVDILNALKTFFDVEVNVVRTVRIKGKARLVGGGNIVQKRHPYKKALITLDHKSKPLDLAAHRTL